MKTLRDTNNNNSNTTSNTNQQHFSSSTTARQNLIASNGSLSHNSTGIDSDIGVYPSLLTQNRLQQQQTIWRANNDQLSATCDSPQITSSSINNLSKSVIQNNNSINHNSLQSSPMQPPFNPFTSIFNGDSNQLSAAMQAYLINAQKLGGNQTLQPDNINPLLYLQLINANSMFLQQLASIQNNAFSTHCDSTKQVPQAHQSSTALGNQQISIANTDSLTETTSSGRNSQILQADSNVFVPKTRPMTQDEIAEHARLVYQRALQRNQLQQQSELMKHFYETLNFKQQDSSVNSNTIIDPNIPIITTNNNQVPSVPNVSNIASVGTFDVLDTMIMSNVSPSSCLSIKESSVEAALSSLSLLSADDSKMMSNTGSILDPGAPIFVPRQSRVKLDDDNETSSSSSDSDFNDFHYLDQFLDEFYNSNNEHDNHLIILKSSSSEVVNIGDEYSNNDNKYTINHNVLGQGDAIDEKQQQQQSTCETIEEVIEQPLPTSVDKQECQYSIYELLNRYRNPRCHLVLPEWSRLALILPNVCSMRGHTYKIKRYFAYRRRLCKDQTYLNLTSTQNKDLEISTTPNISVQG